MSTSIECSRGHFSVRVEIDPLMADQSVLYVLLQCEEHWPGAVLYDQVRQQTIPGRSFTSLRGVTCARVYRNTDELLGSRMFQTPFATVEITRLDQALQLRGQLEGAELVRRISYLPFWRHRASDRVDVP